MRSYETSLCTAAADESSSFSSSCSDPPTDKTSQRTTMTDVLETGYLSAQDAAALDAELMSTPGFSLEQLMELAGLAVAEAVFDVVAVGDDKTMTKKHILLVCG